MNGDVSGAVYQAVAPVCYVWFNANAEWRKFERHTFVFSGLAWAIEDQVRWEVWRG